MTRSNYWESLKSNHPQNKSQNFYQTTEIWEKSCMQHQSNKCCMHACSSWYKNFFTRFSINIEFLNNHPLIWSDYSGYKSEKIENTVVENDMAERAVKFIQYYNTILTKNEIVKQFVLQIISESCKKYSTVAKSLFLKIWYAVFTGHWEESHCSAWILFVLCFWCYNNYCYK